MSYTITWCAYSYPDCEDSKCLTLLYRSENVFDTLNECISDYYRSGTPALCMKRCSDWVVKFYALGDCKTSQKDTYNLTWVAYNIVQCLMCAEEHYIEITRSDESYTDLITCLKNYNDNIDIDKYNTAYRTIVNVEVCRSDPYYETPSQLYLTQNDALKVSIYINTTINL